MTTLSQWSVSVESSPSNVAQLLHEIASRIDEEQVTLISIYNTGFGEPNEACLQIIVEEPEP